MVLCDVSALFLTGEGIFFCDWIGYRMFFGVRGRRARRRQKSELLRCAAGKQPAATAKADSQPAGEG
jgi:hypothetical protein